MRRWLIATLPALVLAILVPATATAATHTVCPTGCDYTAVQAAIDAPATSFGDTISVGPGTYVEQVVANKSVRIEGSGASTVIRAPQVPTVSGGVAPVIDVPAVGSGTVVTRLTVDGDHRDDTGYSLVGIRFHNGTGGVFFTHVTGTRSASLATDPTGEGIVFENTDAVERMVSVQDSTIDDYGTSGIRFEGPGLRAFAYDDTVTGVGATTALAQAGIRYVDGAGGWADGGAISQNRCDVPSTCGPNPAEDARSAGVSLESAAAWLSVSNLTLSDNDVGIVSENGEQAPNQWQAPSIYGNTLESNRYAGMEVDGGQGPNIKQNVFEGGSDGLVVVFRNALETHPVVAGNAFHGQDFGIRALRPTGSLAAAALDANLNLFDGFDGGREAIRNETPGDLNAERNWFGCNGGPAPMSSCAPVVNSPTGSVDFDPWIVFAVRADQPAGWLGEPRWLRAGFFTDSDGFCLNEPGFRDPCPPLGFPGPDEDFSWTATHGSIDPLTSGAGFAENQFTPNEVGTAEITAGAYGEEASTAIEVTDATPVLTQRKLKIHRRTGRATLTVHTDQAGTMTASGPHIFKWIKDVDGEATMRVSIRASDEALIRLRNRGRLRVRINLSFMPVPDRPQVAGELSRTVVLKLKHRRHHR